jgi:uncharacterized protein YkwD
MFRLPNKHFLLLLLLLLDVLLVLDIYKKNVPNKVLGITYSAEKPTKIQREVRNTRRRIVLPIATPTPTKIRKATPTPTKILTETKPQLNNSSPDLLQQINQFRNGKGLTPLSANSETCFFAKMRAQEITSSFNHDGFRNRIDSNSLPYPSYSSVAENIAMNSNPNDVVRSWIDSPGHNANMSKDVPYGCVANSGNYYAFEAWKP